MVPPLRTGYLYPGNPLANFDGVHYLAIATHGYTTNMRFMPLYPILIHYLSFLFPPVWAGIVLSIIFLIGSFIYLNELWKLDYPSKQVRIALLFLLIFPTSFFFWSVYTESLFLFLTVFALYSARKQQWGRAALAGFLASLTRIVGFLIVVPLLIEWYSSKKRSFKDLIALLCTPLGTLAYAVYNWIMWRHPLLFITAHTELNNGRSDHVVLFPQTLYRYFKILITVSPHIWEWHIAGLELAVFIGGCIGVYLLWKYKARLSYVVYVLVSFLVPASSGTFTGLPRYVIVLFPLALLFAFIKNKYLLYAIGLLSVVLQLILFVYFCRGYFVA